MTTLPQVQVNVLENSAVRQFLNAMITKDVRCDENHVKASPRMRETFEWAIENHEIEINDFLVDLRAKVRFGGRMTDKQIAGAINTFRFIYQDRLVGEARQELLNNVVARAQIPQGTYTITNGTKHTTLRLIDCPKGWNKPTGTQMVKYLSGSDNSKDYTLFAWVYPNREVQVKKQYKGSITQINALLALMKCDDAEYIAAGQTWAMKSNHCFICSKPLTDDISIQNGIGPICAGNIGFDRVAPVKTTLPPTARVSGSDLF